MTETIRLPAPAPFELWLVDLREAPAPARLETLSEAERARAGRFVFERDRRRFVAAHCALRQLLSARTGLAPEALRFADGPHGKPALAGRAACAFNLSHSQDVALVAIADGGDIGVDVEVLRPFDDAAALAAQHFTVAERAALAACAGHVSDRAFLLGWTRKEACLKAIGTGLSIAAAAVDAGVSEARRLVAIDTPAGRASVEVGSFIHLHDGQPVVVSLARSI